MEEHSLGLLVVLQRTVAWCGVEEREEGGPIPSAGCSSQQSFPPDVLGDNEVPGGGTDQLHGHQVLHAEVEEDPREQVDLPEETPYEGHGHRALPLCLVWSKSYPGLSRVKGNIS